MMNIEEYSDVSQKSKMFKNQEAKRDKYVIEKKNSLIPIEQWTKMWSLIMKLGIS